MCVYVYVCMFPALTASSAYQVDAIKELKKSSIMSIT